MGREVGSKGRGYMYTYGSFMLRFDRKQNSVKQLSFNKKIFFESLHVLERWKFQINRRYSPYPHMVIAASIAMCWLCCGHIICVLIESSCQPWQHTVNIPAVLLEKRRQKGRADSSAGDLAP